LLAEPKIKGRNPKADRHYSVPYSGRVKLARRNAAEIRAIFQRYTATGLYESFLVSSMATFESFLGDLLLEFLKEYPLRVTERVPGIPTCPDVPASALIRARDKDLLLQSIMEQHVQNVFRQRPQSYLRYLITLIGIEDDSSFAAFYEVAATRDLVVHNRLIVNELYLEKAGDKARGALGDRIIVDKAYFDQAIGIMKRVSGAIKGDVERKYG
jgi:hypothetical protein